jgi:hypothetical protein
MASFPLQVMIHEVVSIFKAATTDEVRQACAEMTHAFLQVFENSTRALMAEGVLDCFPPCLEDDLPPLLVQSAIEALSVLSLYRASEIARQLGIHPFLALFDAAESRVQRSILQIVRRLTSAFLRESFASDLDRLFDIADGDFPDDFRDSAKDTFAYIVRRIHRANVPLPLITRLC